ncbi:MAG: hypothetical protein LKJ44_01470 [Bifidobacteriaceae bacterium]|jgi:hypothetical protein|nr:hypothetical protein [Bifidobacteriaceae bacterium]
MAVVMSSTLVIKWIEQNKTYTTGYVFLGVEFGPSAVSVELTDSFLGIKKGFDQATETLHGGGYEIPQHCLETTENIGSL